MRNALIGSFWLVLMAVFPLLQAQNSFAASLPWSTTYNCNDWTEYGGSLNCDGLSKGGSWTCSPEGYYEHIVSSANNPGGTGGKGQRHWIGDSTNNNSGGTNIALNGPTELWLRWYMRWQPGFKWRAGGSKVLYFNDTAGSAFAYLMINNNPTDWDLYTQTGDQKHYLSSGAGWRDLFPSGASDGSWHFFEVHIKRETGSTSNNGIFEMWVDGVKKASHTNINFGMTGRGAGIGRILIGSNSGGGANGGCAYIDYDDIAASNTGYIGPLSSQPPLASKPNPPTNVRTN